MTTMGVRLSDSGNDGGYGSRPVERNGKLVIGIPRCIDPAEVEAEVRRLVQHRGKGEQEPDSDDGEFDFV